MQKDSSSDLFSQDLSETSFQGIRLIVFDLDGTIVDSFADIAAAANHALQMLGRDTYDVDTVRRYVGHGGRNLMKSLLGEGASEEDIDKAFEGWRSYYSQHPADFAKPYQDVETTLKTLHERGIRLAVISNKLHELTCQILEDLHLAGYFDAIQGEKPSLARKPDPEALRILMKQFSVTEEQTLMVGDGDADMNVARNADVRAIGVSYGVSTKERLLELGASCVVDGFSEIANLGS